MIKNDKIEALKQAREYSVKLQESNQAALHNINNLGEFFKAFSDLHLKFADSIKELSDKYQIHFSGDIHEHDILQSYYQLITNMTIKISNFHRDFQLKIMNQIWEPFEIWTANNLKCGKDIYTSAINIVQELQDAYQKLEQAQKKYFKFSETAEREDENLQRAIHFEEKKMGKPLEIEKISKLCAKAKQDAEEAFQTYKKQISIVNKCWIIYNTQYKTWFEKYDNNELARVNFFKSSIKSFLLFTANLYCCEAEAKEYQNFEKKASEIDKIFIKPISFLNGANTSYIENLFEETIVKFEDWNRTLKIASRKVESVKESAADEKLNDVMNFIDLIVSVVLDSITKNSEDFKIPPQLHNLTDYTDKFATPNIRNYFFDTLSISLKRLPYYIIVKEEILEILRKCVIGIHNNLMKENDRSPEIMYTIVLLGLKFQVVKNKTHVFLAMTLSSLPMWKDFERWQILFDYFCGLRIKENEIQKKIQQGTGDYIISNIMSFGKTFGGIFENKKKSAFEIFYVPALEDVNRLLLHLNIEYDLALEILYDIMKIKKIKKADVAKIFQVQEQKKYSSRSIKRFYDKEKEKRMKWDKLYPMRKALDYLSVKDNLQEILLVNKQFYNRFSPTIAKKFLIENESSLTPKKRILIWESIVKKDPSLPKYSALLLKKYKQDATDQLIVGDVQRSYQSHSNFPHSSLINILRATAHIRGKTYAYHQGMNYIAGVMLMLFEQEDKTFEFFVRVMDQRVGHLYANDFQELNLRFYQTGRMLDIFLPGLANHFKNERIEINVFASWFLIIFSQASQYTEKSTILYKIWDIFLLEGWKGFFKCLLCILKFHEERLLKMRMDDILLFCCELQKSEFFTNTLYFQFENKEIIQVDDKTKEMFYLIKHFLKASKIYDVSNELLGLLKVEYDNIQISLKKAQ